MKGVQIYPAIGKTRLLGEADERVDLGLGWGRYFSQMILRNFSIILSRNFPTAKFCYFENRENSRANLLEKIYRFCSSFKYYISPF